MARYPSAPRTATPPKVGERRWVNGEFEVEVLGFEYVPTMLDNPHMARVWLDPQRSKLDPDNPDVNQNYQDPKTLLTEAEAARQTIAIGYWYRQQVEDARKDLARAQAKLAECGNRAVVMVRNVTGTDLSSINRPESWLRLMEDALNNKLEAHPKHCEGKYLHDPHDWAGTGDDLGWWHCGGVS